MPGPVAIGGVGGSGTRLFAGYLRLLGFYLGDDLNHQLDNLAFTLLFKRPEVPGDTEPAMDRLTDLFFSQFSGPIAGKAELLSELKPSLIAARPQHSRQWLQERFKRFSRTGEGRLAADARWGWKEPNTHVVIDRLLNRRKDLVYIHVMRHGLDMSQSRNRLQLALWGPAYLGREIERTPRDAFAYWCAVHRRIRRLQTEFGARIHLIKYESMIEKPAETCRLIADLAGVRDWEPACERLTGEITEGRNTGRYRSIDITGFDTRDLETLASFGYALG